MSIGIDIGKHSIKIVELAKDKENQIFIKNIGIKDTFEDMSKFDLEKISKSQLSACIQDLCNEMKIKPKKIKQVTSSLSGKSTDVRVVTTIDMPDNELIVSLELEAKKHVPLDGTDAVIDYHHLGSHSEKLDQINVLLATTTKNVIKDHSEILKSSGFKPGVFDSDAIALTNIHQHSNSTLEQNEGCDVIIHFGCTSTTLIVWDGKNQNFFTREINISGNDITKQIMQQFSTDYLTAENKKHESGINVFNLANSSDTENTGIQIEQRTLFNDWIEEIRKTLRFYMKNNSNSFFNKFYISGGGSSTPDLNKFIEQNLNVSVETFDPLINIKNENKINNPSQFSIAIGLALRGLDN